MRCSCLEFEEQAAADPQFRCEHILAVKHSLLAKNTEAVTKQQPSQPAAAAEAPAAEPNTETNASEESRHRRKVAKARVAEPAGSEREQNEAEEKSRHRKPRVSNVRSLAKHTHTEEQEMNKKQDKIAIREAVENEELALAAEPVAPVVPWPSPTPCARSQQVDPNFIKTREGWTDRQGNMHMVEYVEWHTVADILDRVAPTWSARRAQRRPDRRHGRSHLPPSRLTA